MSTIRLKLHQYTKDGSFDLMSAYLEQIKKDYDGNLSNLDNFEPLPKEVFLTKSLLLNIGGLSQSEGWFNVNAQVQRDDAKLQPGDLIDSKQIVRRMDNLHGLEDSSVTAIYTSHTLEHTGLGVGDGGVMRTLREWRRVLKVGGLLLISVPNLETLSKMYLDKSLGSKMHWMVTGMMYGGQLDYYDYHHCGFDEGILTDVLLTAGFCEVERVGNLNVFPWGTDGSTFEVEGYAVSLNMIARPCVSMEPGSDDYAGPPSSYLIGHQATPYDVTLYK